MRRVNLSDCARLRERAAGEVHSTATRSLRESSRVGLSSEERECMHSVVAGQWRTTRMVIYLLLAEA